jgi:hypothetical protein
MSTEFDKKLDEQISNFFPEKKSNTPQDNTQTVTSDNTLLVEEFTTLPG